MTHSTIKIGLRWWLAGLVRGLVWLGAAWVEALRLTVESGVGRSATPFWLVSKLVAVPGCKLVERAVAALPPTVCGLCVAVCVPEPLLAVSGVLAITLL